MQGGPAEWQGAVERTPAVRIEPLSARSAGSAAVQPAPPPLLALSAPPQEPPAPCAVQQDSVKT